MRRILSALLLLLALAPQTARADEGIAVFSGLTTGIGFLHQGLDSPGWTIGGEVSAVYYSEDINILSGDGDVWAAGGYVDALWDFGSDSLRVSMGPELVWFFFGVDGGYLLQLHDGRGAPHRRPRVHQLHRAQPLRAGRIDVGGGG
jgi:hypothetical protein